MTAALSDSWAAAAESAVRRAVRLAMQDPLSEDEAVKSAMAALFESKLSTMTQRRQAEERVSMLAKYDELVATAGGHFADAVGIVARRFAEQPSDRENLERRLRRAIANRNPDDVRHRPKARRKRRL